MSAKPVNRSVNISTEVVPGGENDASVLQQVTNALNRAAVQTTNVTYATGVTSFNGNTGVVTGVGSLAGLTGTLTLTVHDDLVSSTSGSDIRIYHRPGFRWPTSGQNFTITETDSTIYGTSGQHAGTVTFPLAASYPGKKVLFSYPPGGLAASGSDTYDAYANNSAEYQSDGVSHWYRIWSV